MSKSKTLVERFWSKVSKDADGHWRWTGACCSNGYGHLKGPDGKNILAHRLSLAWATGTTGEGLDAAHDDAKGCPRTCVNPEHLTWKPHSENMKDVIRKNGRLFYPVRKSKDPLPLFTTIGT